MTMKMKMLLNRVKAIRQQRRAHRIKRAKAESGVKTILVQLGPDFIEIYDRFARPIGYTVRGLPVDEATFYAALDQ